MSVRIRRPAYAFLSLFSLLGLVLGVSGSASAGARHHVKPLVETILNQSSKTSSLHEEAVIVPGRGGHFVPVRVKTIIKGTSKNSLHEVRLTEIRPKASVGDPGGTGGICLVAQQTTIGGLILIGKAWTKSCDEPADCMQQAALQVFDTFNGTWQPVDSGVNTSGCVYANRSVASQTCQADSTSFKFRTRGIYTILWDDGDVSGPVTFFSATISAKALC